MVRLTTIGALIGAMLAGLAVFRFARAADSATGAPLRVAVSIPPLKGLVEALLTDAKIAGSVESVIPPGVSEHGYELPPSKVALVSSADLVVLVGLGLDPQIEQLAKTKTIAAQSNRLIVLADALGIDGAEHDHHHHDHDHAHDDHHHHHHGPDPHIWLDPALVEKTVSAIAKTLRDRFAADPETKAGLVGAEEALIARVRAVDALYRERLAGDGSRTIVVGHDAWRRLADRYDLKTIPIEGLAATEPTPAALHAAAKAVREHAIPCVFVEPQLGAAGAKRIADASGVPVRTLDPLGSGDWFALMNTNLESLCAALGCAPTPREQPSTTGAER